MRWLRRCWYVALTFRSYADRLNRCVEVENVLASVASGKRGLLSPDECRALARKLGVLSWAER